MQIHLGGEPVDSNVVRRFKGGDRDMVGTRVSSMGDIDGDGYSEFVIGAPGYSSDRGRVYVSDILLPDFADGDGNGVSDTCEVSTGIGDTASQHARRILGCWGHIPRHSIQTHGSSSNFPIQAMSSWKCLMQRGGG